MTCLHLYLHPICNYLHIYVTWSVSENLSFWALGLQQAGISPFLMCWEEQLLPHGIRVKAGGGHWEGRGSHSAATLGASNPHNALQRCRTLNLCWMNCYVCSRNMLQFLSRMGISVPHHRPQLSLPLNWAALRLCHRMAVYCIFIETRFLHKPCVMQFHSALHEHGHAAHEYHLTLHVIQHTHSATLRDLSSMFEVSNIMHTEDWSSARAHGQTPQAHAWHSLSFFCSGRDLLVVTCTGWLLVLPSWWCLVPLVLVRPMLRWMGHKLREKGCVDLRGQHLPLHQCQHATILQK